MSKSLDNRLKKIEDRTIIRTRPVYRETTEPFDKYGYPSPVVEIVKHPDGRLDQNPKLLTLEEVKQQFATHPKLDKILEHQAKCIKEDSELKTKILMGFAPELMKKAVLIVDEKGRYLRIEIPLDGSESADPEFDDHILFNIREYGSTPSEAVAWAAIQRWNKLKELNQ